MRFLEHRILKNQGVKTMNSNETLFNIANIDENTNFWMIRAKRGFFFEEFLQNEFIAIGWNSITKSMINPTMPKNQADGLKEELKKIYGENRPGTALNKCIRFCHELKIGDIAVIVDANRIAFAYIGEYYEDTSKNLTVDFEKETHEKIEKANPNLETFICPYVKRRKITLIKLLGEGDVISPYLQTALARNWHSLSDLNDYAELVLSGCFDTFIFKNKLNITFRVRTKENINVLDLSNFVLNAAKLLSNDHPETVHVKTTLHSPGDVILQVWNFAQENALPLLMCYMTVFGGKVGDYEFNSLIGIIKSIINSKYDKKKRELELRKLSAEANLLEQQAIEKELENIEKRKQLQLESVDAHGGSLASAAKNLEIKPCEATIIDITNIVKQHQEEQNP